jgi:hypothetical protein
LDGHIAVPPVLGEFDNDWAAVESAKGVLDWKPIEVWQYSRRVTRIELRLPTPSGTIGRICTEVCREHPYEQSRR